MCIAHDYRLIMLHNRHSSSINVHVYTCIHVHVGPTYTEEAVRAYFTVLIKKHHAQAHKHVYIHTSTLHTLHTDVGGEMAFFSPSTGGLSGTYA